MTTQADSQLAHRSEVTPPSRKTVQLSSVPVERFADYSIVAKIGQGGMAEVFLAMTDGPSGFRKLLALKRLHAHLYDEPEDVDSFLTEATLAARLHHPNIVQTNEVGSFAGQHYLAMEYLDGQPLDRVLARLRKEESCLSPELAVAIACEALEGLHYAHEACDYDGSPLGAVHRDVSPHNLFITYDGQVKVLDFGIAKTKALQSHTRSGIIKGKLSYIAPEQARGEVVDRRADVWSMGVTLWQCLSGRRLFRGDSEVAVLRATLRDEIPLLSTVSEDLPKELALVVDGALRRNREQRVATAQQLKNELDSWLATRPPLSLRPALSGLMKALFHDQIEARKQPIAACFAQVAQQGATPAASSSWARDSSTPAEPAAAFGWPTRKRPWLAGALIACVPLAAALLALLRSAPAAVEAARAPARALTAAHALQTGAASSAKPAPTSDGNAHAPFPERWTSPSAQPVAAASQRASTRHGSEAPIVSARAVRERRRAASLAHLETQAEPAARDASHATTPSPGPASEPEPRRGHLSLDTVPYSVVMLDGQRLGITPLEVDLVARTHTLTLRNPEHGVQTAYQVTIKPGETIERHVALE